MRTTIRVMGALALAAATLVPCAEGAQTLTYTYDAIGRLTSVTYDGTLTTVYRYDMNGNIVLIATGATPVAVDEESTPPALPRVFALRAAVPNPLRGRGVVRYEVPHAENVSLEVFDVSGRRVRTLVDERQAPGYYRATWDGRDDAGLTVASGVYYTRLTAGSFSGVERISVVR